MTVIDVHTHMPGDVFRFPEAATPDMFLALLDRNGVDQAWVFTLDGLCFDPAPYNDLTKQFCDYNPRRLIPFCTVHPHYANAADELRRCVVGLGMKGVKFHPWLQGFSAVDPALDALGEDMSGLGVPVMFHDGTPPNCSPMQIAYFARRHPRLTVILGHGGLHDLWKEAMHAAELCDNIFLVLLSMPMHGLRQALRRLGPERFLFGSDTGFADPYWLPFNLSKVRALHLTPEAEALIMSGNAARILAASGLHANNR